MARTYRWFFSRQGDDFQTGVRSAYEQHLLRSHQSHIAVIALVVGLFNGLLLIPDLLLTKPGDGRWIILAFRLIYAVLALLLAWLCHNNRVRTFIGFANLVSIYEIGAMVVYFLIMSQYQPPDFLIQAMGLIIILMCLFFIPNLWTNMLALAIVSIAAFLLLTRVLIPDLPVNQYAAGAVYLIVAAVLCALFAYYLDKHRFLEYKAKQEQIQMNATDPLTKAHSRYKLAEAYETWTAYSRRHQSSLTLAIFDIDQFKHVNDLHGHVIADQAMVELVSLISMQMRSLDVLARWGGDEFVLLLPHTDLQTAAYVTDRIRRIIEKTRLSRMIQLTCSFGLVHVDAAQTLDQTVEQADIMMYQAKRNGGNQVFFQEMARENS
jgi:diguanylate cyclase (GGDEF)-like protein